MLFNNIYFFNFPLIIVSGLNFRIEFYLFLPVLRYLQPKIQVLCGPSVCAKVISITKKYYRKTQFNILNSQYNGMILDTFYKDRTHSLHTGDYKKNLNTL